MWRRKQSEVSGPSQDLMLEEVDGMVAPLKETESAERQRERVVTV